MEKVNKKNTKYKYKNKKNTQSFKKSRVLEKNIIENIYRLEIKRVMLTLIKYAFLFLFSILSIITIGTIIIRILNDQQTFDLMEIFKEDWEIIREFLPDVFYVFYTETPKDLIVILFIFTLLLILLVFLIAKNFAKIKNKVNSIIRYLK